MPRRQPPNALEFVDTIFGEDLHAKRVESLANAAHGALKAARFGVAAIGRALAVANGLDPRHAIKQVDRMLSNPAIQPWQLFAAWVPFVIGARKEIVVALDWTEFDEDDQSTIALHLVTRHGRATPLVWKTAVKSELGGRRNAEEDALLVRFSEVLPPDVKVTVLADRGFGDTKLFEFLHELGFDYVIRFRGVVQVTSANGETRPAADWLPAGGRAGMLRDARVTGAHVPVRAVVFTHAKAMKEPWFLASSLQLPASEIIKLYGRRFTIEESFRDIKDPRFGRGLREMRISKPQRRDRILLIAALAIALLTLLGAAGEKAGLDRTLRANTVTKRTHSLYFQGTYYYSALPNMKDHRARPLLEAFDQIVSEHAVFTQILGVL